MAKYNIFKDRWFLLLIILAFSLIIALMVKKLTNQLPQEGFLQDTPFVLKTNNDIYDSYYAMVYDDIYKPKPRAKFEYEQIIEVTQPSKENSVFLDIGSGTGDLVNEFTENGFDATGVDRSKAMVDVCTMKYPALSSSIKCNSVSDPMMFEKGSFTHITCMHFTIYEFKDKHMFFKNCYHWLMPNGYLIIHLVDRDKYSPVVPGAITNLNKSYQEHTQKRYTKSAIDFEIFTYNNDTSFDKPNQVNIKETFKDAKNGCIRQNEMVLHMETSKNILFVAKENGFILHSQLQYVDDVHQFIYILEKQL